MAASINNLHKPLRLDADPSSPNGAKRFKHWLRVFTGFLERCEATVAAQEAVAPNRLQILFIYESADVYEHVEDCEIYVDAIQNSKTSTLEPQTSFLQPSNSNQETATRRNLEEFYQSLHVMSKHCGPRDVTAEEYRNELVGDAFISGIASHSIRQRLLENS